jgi:hypothetical protein
MDDSIGCHPAETPASFNQLHEFHVVESRSMWGRRFALERIHRRLTLLTRSKNLADAVMSALAIFLDRDGSPARHDYSTV